MKKRPPKFSVKDYLASLQKPIHVSDKKALKAQAVVITTRAIEKARREVPSFWYLGTVTEEHIEAFRDFVESFPSRMRMQARALTAVASIIADLQSRHRRSKD